MNVSRPRRKVTVVRPFPISIDFEDHELTRVGRSREGNEPLDITTWSRRRSGGHQHRPHRFTKGIPERCASIACGEAPLAARVIFVQIGVPSRTHVKAYQTLDDEVDAPVEKSIALGTDS